MAAPLYTTDSGQLFHAGKIIIICVGLPGMDRGLFSIMIDGDDLVQPAEKHIYLAL